MNTITLAHGSGSKATNELIVNLFKKYLDNQFFTSDDAALLPPITGKIAMSTDGFIVSPYKFNGGNIGKLSICGSVNDVACMGAIPKYMTLSFIIEEGFLISELEEIVQSISQTAKQAGIYIVAGDTKVASKGQVDHLFITTTCIGEVINGLNLSGKNACVSDKIIVTGDIGRHGTCILLERNDYGIKANIKSDCAPLNKLFETIYSPSIHTIRDCTRGGVGSVLYEIANESQVGIKLYHDIPVSNEVQGVTNMLGLDPIYLANEGTAILVVEAKVADKVVNELRKHEYGKHAAIIGEVNNRTNIITRVSEIGTEALLPPPGNELLPRIC